MIEKLTGKIIQWRWMVTAATLGAVVLATTGLRGIYFESDYRIYFPEVNPQRVSHEDMHRMFANLLQLSCYLDEVKISLYIKFRRFWVFCNKNQLSQALILCRYLQHIKGLITAVVYKISCITTYISRYF